MNKLMIFLSSVFFTFSCSPSCNDDETEKYIKEIKLAETAFAKTVAEHGLHAGFVQFAAEDAAILRNNQLILGHSAIDSFYSGSDVTGLSWTPEYIDVSRSGDLGYSYGYYSFKTLDDDAKIRQNEGVFHTVWKRQEDGKWKFVWD